MRELFVYYRIDARDAPRCEALVHDFQHRLTLETPLLRARLLARPATPDGEETWMETYAVEGPASHGVDAELEARVEAAAQVLAPHLRGPRHVEVFVPRTQRQELRRQGKSVASVQPSAVRSATRRCDSLGIRNSSS